MGRLADGRDGQLHQRAAASPRLLHRQRRAGRRRADADDGAAARRARLLREEQRVGRDQHEDVPARGAVRQHRRAAHPQPAAADGRRVRAHPARQPDVAGQHQERLLGAATPLPRLADRHALEARGQDGAVHPGGGPAHRRTQHHAAGDGRRRQGAQPEARK